MCNLSHHDRVGTPLRSDSVTLHLDKVITGREAHAPLAVRGPRRLRHSLGQHHGKLLHLAPPGGVQPSRVEDRSCIRMKEVDNYNDKVVITTIMM